MRDRRTRKHKLDSMAPASEVRRMADVVRRTERFFAQIAPDVIRKITEAEVRADHAEKEFARISDKLESLLTPQQTDAAKTCGIPPWLYAIEFIDMWKEKMFPRFGAIGVETFAKLKHTTNPDPHLDQSYYR